MDPIRLHDLQASLRHELSRQSEERHLGPTARVVWLVDQLENYVERWVGLCEASLPSQSPISDDLFQMVQVGAEAVSEELKGLQTPVIEESWQWFLTMLANARIPYDSLMRRQLAEKLAVVRFALRA